jgi:hypothetical protein
LPELHRRAVDVSVNLNKLHYKRELDDYSKALSYAQPEMECFDTLLSKVEEFTNKIKNCDIILKALYET